MKISVLDRSLFVIFVAASLLAGCGAGVPAAQSVSASPGITPPGRSWMLPEARVQKLLYISDYLKGAVWVYLFPTGKLEGELRQPFQGPDGECVDKAGNVWITNSYGSQIIEYAHGGTKPIATLTVPGYQETRGCALDPTTGNLAVTSWGTSSSFPPGNLAIFRRARGVPKTYLDPAIAFYSYCVYDGAGNLFLDGWSSTRKFVFAELPKGGTSLKKITLSQSIGYPGGVAWDGKYVTVGDEQFQKNVVYEFAISGTHGTKKGTTPLGGALYVFQYSLYGGKTLVGPTAYSLSPQMGAVMYWPYPAGGSYTRTIVNYESELYTGSAISE